MRNSLSMSIIFALAVMACISLAQPPIEWRTTYDGNGYYDCLNAVELGHDNDYVAVGFTSHPQNQGDALILNLNEDGSLNWAHSWGWIGHDVFNSVGSVNDGGYIIGGRYSDYMVGNNDIWLMKTTAYGDSLWSKFFGTINGGLYSDDYCGQVQQTADGGYAIIGTTCTIVDSPDIWFVKTDSQGNLQWSQTYGNSWSDEGTSLQQCDDGGYIIVGMTFDLPNWNYNSYAVRINGSGNVLWTRIYGRPTFPYDDLFQSVQQTADGGYIMAGTTNVSMEINLDFFVVRTDPQGLPIWTKTIGNSIYDMANCIRQTADGGFIVVGMSFDPDSARALIVKLDADGNVVWQKLLNNSVPSNQQGGVANSVRQTADGGYVIAGEMRFPGQIYNDACVIKLAEDTSSTNLIKIKKEIPRRASVSPNPFNPTTTINYALSNSGNVILRVYDINGRQLTELVNGWAEAGTHSITFDGSALSSGIYLYRLEANNHVTSGKMMLVK